MSTKASDIVVGIDFGTTYSGISWAYPGRRDIRVIVDWPNPGSRIPNSAKVPSSINYYNGEVQRWGFGNVDKDATLRWIKILLEPSHKYHNEVEPVMKSNKMLPGIGKTADQVVTDYLSKIWQYATEDIRKEQGTNWRQDYALKVVITVPAMWSHLAKEKTKQAAIAAGIPDDLTMITEPEAAALTVLRDRADNSDLQAGDCFVVCDAGGGTVDLISYSVHRLKPFEIKEAAKGEGGLCGSVYLDIAFEKYIETIVGKSQYANIGEASKRRMRKDFETGVKHSFSETSDQEFSVELFGVKDNPDEGIEDNTITLKTSALKSIFDPIILGILRLISNQIAQIRKGNKDVKAIVLVGGFGLSSYLFERIEKCYKSEGIRVLRAQDAWAAICRGATLAGLEGLGGVLGPLAAPKVISRIATHSYGFVVSQDFNPSEHDWRDRYIDPFEGTPKARGQMLWALEIGDQVEEGKILEKVVYESVDVGFWSSGYEEFEVSLFCCDETVVPKRKTDKVFELCNVSFRIPRSKLWLEESFRHPVTHKKGRNAIFKLIILLGKASLDFVVGYRGEPVAHVEARYKEEFVT